MKSKYVTKFVATILMVILTMSLITLPAMADTFIVTSRNGINVRDELGDIVGVLSYGELVNVYKAKSKYMYAIVWHGGMHYVTNEGMRLATEEEIEQASQRSQMYIASTNLLGRTIRETPVFNSEDKILGRLPEGEIVRITRTRRDKYTIEYNGSHHFVDPDDVQVYDADIPGDGTLYRVTSEYEIANLRESATKDSKLVATLKPGWYVRVTEAVNDKWVKVVYDAEGHEAYLGLVYLQNAENDNVFRIKD